MQAVFNLDWENSYLSNKVRIVANSNQYFGLVNQ